MADFYDYVEPDTNQADENKIVRTALTNYPTPFLSGMKLGAGIQLWNPATETALTLNTIEMPNPLHVEQDSSGVSFPAAPENKELYDDPSTGLGWVWYDSINTWLRADTSRRLNDYNKAVVWVVTDIDGWWNLPDSELPDLPRGWGDGSYDAIGRWANRIITLDGTFMPQGPEDASLARNALMEFLSPMVKTTTAIYLIVDEEDLDNPGEVIRKSAKVRLSGTPSITSTNARGRHDFSIGLKAVDPIKYEFVDGDPDGYESTLITVGVSGAGQGAITNRGNIAVPILLEFSDGLDGSGIPTIENTENKDKIELVGGTDANVKLEIDTYNREALEVTYDAVDTELVTNVANGRSNLSVLVKWIYLEPGENVITLTGFQEGETCTIYHRSGWIG